MTTTNEKTKETKVPDFHIFDTIEVDGKKARKRVGVAFAHKTGTGYTLLIGSKRYAAFLPLPQAEGKGA